jgi:hypothetical protein
MDARPIYWVLCGAGATLLTSAWGSRQVVVQPQDQNMLAPISQTNFGSSQLDTNNSLMKRQPWAKPKADPFSKVHHVVRNVVAPPVVMPVATEPISFPYVFFGRMLSGDKNAVFLSRNNLSYIVAAGDTLDSVYRIDSVGINTLEITYLPEQKKLTFPFDSLATAVKPDAALAQTSTQVLHQEPDMAAVAPVEFRQPATPQPTEEEVLRMMGATRPTPGNPMEAVISSPVVDAQGMPGAVSGGSAMTQPNGK